jgi:hypothetical protein
MELCNMLWGCAVHRAEVWVHLQVCNSLCDSLVVLQGERTWWWSVKWDAVCVHNTAEVSADGMLWCHCHQIIQWTWWVYTVSVKNVQKHCHYFIGNIYSTWNLWMRGAFSPETSCTLGVLQTVSSVRLSKVVMNQPLWWTLRKTIFWAKKCAFIFILWWTIDSGLEMSLKCNYTVQGLMIVYKKQACKLPESLALDSRMKVTVFWDTLLHIF